jgi:hypothetical protein
MNRKGAWITVGIVCTAVIAFSLANAFAQRGDTRGPGYAGFGGPAHGRFMLVNFNPSTENFIILDTATGELYGGRGRDIKSYSEKPRFDMVRPDDRRDAKVDDRRDAKVDGFREDKKADDRPKDADKRPIDKGTILDEKPRDKPADDKKADDRPKVDEKRPTKDERPKKDGALNLN